MVRVNAWKYAREIYLIGRSHKFRYLNKLERQAVIYFIVDMMRTRNGIAARLNLKYENAGKELEKQNDYALLKMVQIIGRSLKIQCPLREEVWTLDGFIEYMSPRGSLGYKDYETDKYIRTCPECGYQFDAADSSECPLCGWGHEEEQHTVCPNCRSDDGIWWDQDGKFYCDNCGYGYDGQCPNCGESLYDNDFCGYCGWNGGECPECGQKLFGGGQCPNCGWGFVYNICPNCGSPGVYNNDQGHDVCPDCGWSDVQLTNCPNCGSELQTSEVTGRKYCLNCFWSSDEDDNCPICGQPLVEVPEGEDTEETHLICENCEWQRPK